MTQPDVRIGGMRRAGDIGAALLFLFVLCRQIVRGSRDQQLTEWLCQQKAREIKTSVADHRYMRGQIDLPEYERELAAIWGLDA